MEACGRRSRQDVLPLVAAVDRRCCRCRNPHRRHDRRFIRAVAGGGAQDGLLPLVGGQVRTCVLAADGL